MKIWLKFLLAAVSTFVFLFVVGNIHALTIDSTGDIWLKIKGAVLSRSVVDEPQATTNTTTGTESVNKGQLRRLEVGSSKSLEVRTRQGKMLVTLDDEDNEEQGGEEIELEEGEEIEVEESTGSGNLKIRNQEDKILIMKNKLLAQTHFPLMVNLETNELIVTTPKGSKVVTILPDAAVAHMLAANVLDQLGGKGGFLWLEYMKQFATPTPEATASASPEASPEETATPEATASAEPSPTESTQPTEVPTEEPSPSPTSQEELPITLTQLSDGTLVYEIKGIKQKKLLWVYQVDVPRTAIVSAETGELIGIRRTFGATLLDVFSF